MTMCIGNSTNSMGAPMVTTVDVDASLVLNASSDYKQLKRQVTLQELAISSLEKENEELRKELEEIKNFIYNKQ